MYRFLVLMLSVLNAGISQAQYAKRTGIDLSCKHVSPIEQSYLARHINFTQASSNLESRVVTQFIEKLDGTKLYLLEKDVEKIKKEMASIFKKTRARECGSIERAHDVLKERVKVRLDFVRAKLNGKFEVDKNVEFVFDPDKRKFSKTDKEANQFIEKYLHFQLATYIATETPLEEAKANVIKSYERVYRRVADFKDPDLYAMYLDAFARALDPHSSYLAASELEDFEIQMGLSLEGIGATLSSRDGFTVIEQLIPGGAAARSGQLRPKDKIISVAQDAAGKFENVIEMDLRDVVSKIRGKSGTTVRLNILRKEGKETVRFEVTLKRDRIKLEDEAARITYVDREVKEPSGKKLTRRVGVLNLPGFYADSRRQGRSAAKDMKKLIEEANSKAVDAIVLDLSTNGGGSLDDAVKIAGLFFASGNVVKQSSRNTNRGELELADDDPTVDFSGPLVVLISRVSASASEIVAGTLQDYKRAVVVGGDHTFGKGSVQSVEPLPPGLGALKTTVGMFFVPGGKSTQHLGVESDIVFPSAFSNDEIGEKTLDYSLPPKKIKPFLSKSAYVATGPQAWKEVDAKLLKELSERSKTRVDASTEFKKIKDEIIKAQAKGKVLKVAELLDNQEERDKKKKEEEAKLDAATGTLNADEKRKLYLERADIQESMNIAFDYVSLSGPKLMMTKMKPPIKDVVISPDPAMADASGEQKKN